MNPEQELQIIAAIIAERDAATPRRLGLDPSWFNYVPAQMALQSIYTYVDTHNAVPGESYIAQFLGMAAPLNPQAGTLESQCAAARVSRLRGQLAVRVEDIRRAVAEDPLEAMRRLQELAGDPSIIGLTETGASTQFADGAGELYRQLPARAASGGILGLETPYSGLTTRLRGLQRGGFYVAYAPEKSFKTYVALTFAEHVYRQGRRVLVVSSEMTAEEMVERLVAINRRLSTTRLAEGDIGHDAYRDFRDDLESYDAARSRDIHIFIPRGSGAQAVEEVRAEIIRLNSDGRLGLVVWDGHYRSASSDEWEAVYSLVRRTRQVPLDIRTRQVPMLVTTQEGSERGKVAFKAYAQEATVQFLVNRLPNNRVEIIVNRIRNGIPGKHTLEVDWATTTFREIVRSTPDSDFDL